MKSCLQYYETFYVFEFCPLVSYCVLIITRRDTRICEKTIYFLKIKRFTCRDRRWLLNVSLCIRRVPYPTTSFKVFWDSHDSRTNAELVPKIHLAPNASCAALPTFPNFVKTQPSKYKIRQYLKFSLHAHFLPTAAYPGNSLPNSLPGWHFDLVLCLQPSSFWRMSGHTLITFRELYFPINFTVSPCILIHWILYTN